MHERALANYFDGFRRKPKAHGQVRRIGGDALRVAGRVSVHLVDGARQTLDRLLEGGPQVLVESRVLDRSGSARSHDRQELAMTPVAALLLREAGARNPAHDA